jgi:hypothetical protein
MSANEKNRCARGDYDASHWSQKAVKSKKKFGHCSNTVDYCSKSLFTIVHCWLFTALFTVYYSLHCLLFSVDFSLSKSMDSDSATTELGIQQQMVAK